MSEGPAPAFGEADLSNCERELIHLAGSVQPHGVLLVTEARTLRLLQVSANAGQWLGRAADALRGEPLASLGSALESAVRALGNDLRQAQALRCELRIRGANRRFEGQAHRMRSAIGDLLLIELEPMDIEGPTRPVHLPRERLLPLLDDALRRVSGASTLPMLADALVRSCRELLGYDRVMVYRFDPDGHGQIIAEARDARLDSLLGHRYPATDIPMRARELYLRMRLRVLVDVHAEAAPLVPRQVPGSEDELDMSLCSLRSMSPLHLQYLKNMGVTATLVVSLVHEGRLWGLIACHHYSPRNLRFALRSATDLLAEIASTRIAAIENYAHAQVAIQVRRLEQRLVEATATEGDWRLALLRNPRTLLQPLDATGAALFCEGEVLTCGETPTLAELLELSRWIDSQGTRELFSCSSVGRAHPPLQALTPTASGVVAVRLSNTQPDWLVWLRKEQLQSRTWGGDPTKPTVQDDPLTLSPRRSFAAWSEIVRGTAVPWTDAELELARAFGAALVDIRVQVNAVRLLIAEHQLAQVRAQVADAREPVLIVDARQRALFCNQAFERLRGSELAGADSAADCFGDPDRIRSLLATIVRERQPWQGELTLRADADLILPVRLRIEPVPARDGSVLGFFMLVTDLRGRERAAEARRHLEASLSRVATGSDAGQGSRRPDGRVTASDHAGGLMRRPDERATHHNQLMQAILANASLAAMDIADGTSGEAQLPLLEALESSTRRATELFARVSDFSRD